MNPNRNNRPFKPQNQPTIQQAWLEIVDKLKKDKNPLYELLKDTQLREAGDNLNLYIASEEKRKETQGKIPKIQAKMPLHWQNKRLNLVVGLPPTKTEKQPLNQSKATARQVTLKSPLQELKFAKFGVDKNQELVQPVLEAATDKTCTSLYQQLTEKTKSLAEDTITIKFPWRLRVGGMRGFRELLLPVFHPVYGVHYIPSSSLKGAIRAIALQDNPSEVKRLLGQLDEGIGCVQILDAFPTAPCLSVDMANPQWHWQQNSVKYNSEPHALLSLKQPQFVIGLRRTSRLSSLEDVDKVKGWLQKALASGIGSRLSAGYGRTTMMASLPHSSSHKFQLWTQGMYAASTDNPEFRPVALRGMLRYWFRAIALALYSPSECKALEANLFGTIEPKSKEGSIRIAVEWEAKKSDRAYVYEGTILLEARQKSHLSLIENILYLSSHLAGIGRGSRRPLHWNSDRMRGCYWQLADKQLACDHQVWQKFLQEVRDSFLKVQSASSSVNISNPGSSRKGERYQDVLNPHARIYLIPCTAMKHPRVVEDWAQEGHKSTVTGRGLDLLYSSDKYKGERKVRENTYIGNSEVGGKLSTPSFVLIKSNFPNAGNAYQTVTIFGAEQSDRATFERALPPDSLQVW